MLSDIKVSVPEAQFSPGKEQRWRWYHGIMFYLVVQGITFGLAGLVSGIRGRDVRNVRELFGDTRYFRSLQQVKITPPSWAFAPAWTINALCTIWGLLRVLNKPHGTEGRDEYLVLQAASWVNYMIFSAAYFSLRSPINALIVTFSMFVLTILSGLVALFRLRDSWVALSLATLFAWLLIALIAALFQAVWNKDEFYQVGPFVRPIPALMKSRQR